MMLFILDITLTVLFFISPKRLHTNGDVVPPMVFFFPNLMWRQHTSQQNRGVERKNDEICRSIEKVTNRAYKKEQTQTMKGKGGSTPVLLRFNTLC